MSRAVISESLLTDIADAIRAKGGSSASLTPAEMAEAIENIPSGDVPAFLYDLNAEFPQSYVWPWATAKAYQLCRKDTVRNLTNFFETLDLGSITEIPYQFAANGAVSYETESHPLHTIIGRDVLTVGEFAFDHCHDLATIQMPKLKTVGRYAFRDTSITSLPESLETAGDRSFQYSSLTTVNLPKMKYVACFYQCPSLVSAFFKQVDTIAGYAFYNSTNLETIVIDDSRDSVTTLSNKSAFDLTKIAVGTGYIYVPDSKVDAFKGATNWSIYANQIKPLSEYSP